MVSLDVVSEEKWYKGLNLDEISSFPDNTFQTVYVDNRAILITQLEGSFSAIDNSCPHQGGPLGDGKFDKDGYVQCPWHAWQFDPKTGEAPPGYEDCVAAYETEMREDGLYVQLPELPQFTTVADQLVDVLVDWNVKTVFGIIGHSNLAFGEALRRREKDINFIGVRHEGAASFAASAYGKLTGEPGVCLTIAGPGATNLLTGLYDGKLDRNPIVALTGQIETQFLGPDSFQEIDLLSAFSDVTVWNEAVYQSGNASELMALAIKHAILERAVTQLSLPDEVQKQGGTINKVPREGRLANVKISGDPDLFQKIVQVIKGAKQACIIAGHGVSQNRQKLKDLLKKVDIPVVTTFKGKGIISDHHPLGCGVLGSSGTPVGSDQVANADVLIVLGASFSKKTGIPKSKTIIQVDIDPVNLGKKQTITYPYVSDIGVFLSQLTTTLPEMKNPKLIEEIKESKLKWLEERKKRADRSSPNLIHPALVFTALSELASDGAVIAADVGNNAYSLGRYFTSKEQEFVLSGYLGSIGYAYPAAIGACMARPGKQIIAVAGDGGFAQYLAEFLTAVKYNLPITLIILNNGELAKISNEQRSEKFPIFATQLTNPSFAEFANICGGVGFRVEKPEEVKKAIEEGLMEKKPSIVEIITDPLAD